MRLIKMSIRILDTMKVFLRNLFRKKQNLTNDLETPLLRCLNLFDLIFLCVSGMIGSGIYVLTGVVAKQSTGPAILISNLLAACACLSGKKTKENHWHAFISVWISGALCYAEFAARIPRAGSSYIYIYESLGEMLAFLVVNRLAEGILSVQIILGLHQYRRGINEFRCQCTRLVCLFRCFI